MTPSDAIVLRDLCFRYPGAPAPLFHGLDLRVPAGSRCLLLGQNGTGKTTLLRILAGKHMVPEAAAEVLGASAFHATALVHRVAFLGGAFPFDVDMSVREILAPRLELHPERAPRAARLLDILGVDAGWRMHRLSDGQRRRVQVTLGLLDAVDLVLLDEVTADLDVLARADLLALLKEESEARGATVLYATHVLDGLERWATHLCFLSPALEGSGRGSRVRVMAPLGEVPELRELAERGATSPILALCERWLREDRARRGAPGASSGPGLA